MGVFLDQKLGFCYTCSMKKYIAVLALALAGCSALKTNNAPNAYFSGSADVADIRQQIAQKQNNVVQLQKLLADFPGRAMDIETSQPKILSQNGNQISLEITIKSNFKQQWLINLWQNLYGLGDPGGRVTQISVYTAYDINGPDHWDTSRFVRGTVKYADRLTYNTVMRELVSSNPTVRLTFINQRNQALYTQVVDVPALTHSYVDQTTPVFVDVGWKSDMRPFNFDWPVAPIQMRIRGDQPIYTKALVTVDSAIIAQTTRINAQMIRQNQ